MQLVQGRGGGDTWATHRQVRESVAASTPDAGLSGSMKRVDTFERYNISCAHAQQLLRNLSRSAARCDGRCCFQSTAVTANEVKEASKCV